MPDLGELVTTLTDPQREVFELIVSDPEGYDDGLVADYLSLDSVGGVEVTAGQVAAYREEAV